MKNYLDKVHGKFVEKVNNLIGKEKDGVDFESPSQSKEEAIIQIEADKDEPKDFESKQMTSLQACLKNYKLIELIGKGSFGFVYKARCITTGKIVAVKLMTDIFKNYLRGRAITREITILRKLTQMG